MRATAIYTWTCFNFYNEPSYLFFLFVRGYHGTIKIIVRWLFFNNACLAFLSVLVKESYFLFGAVAMYSNSRSPIRLCIVPGQLGGSIGLAACCGGEIKKKKEVGKARACRVFKVCLS